MADIGSSLDKRQKMALFPPTKKLCTVHTAPIFVATKKETYLAGAGNTKGLTVLSGSLGLIASSGLSGSSGLGCSSGSRGQCGVV